MLFTLPSRVEPVKPLIKWAGGKRNLLKVYKKLFPKKFNNYCEPFFRQRCSFFLLKPSKGNPYW